MPVSADETLTLAEAMKRAADDTPGAVSDLAERKAADARLQGARVELWPELALSGGATTGTGNVVAGGVFQSGGFPVVSGPPAAEETEAGWQSLAGLTARWDLLGLVARVREVDAALAATERSGAVAEAQRQSRAMSAGMAWLQAAQAADEVDVARTDVERGREVARAAEALVEAGLRPGVERTLAAADLAIAEQRLATVDGRAAATRARLALAVGQAGSTRPASGAVPAVPELPAANATHPLIRANSSMVEEADSRLHATRARFAPRLDLAAAGWMRSGQWPPGEQTEVVPNWAVGLVLEIPLRDLASRASEAQALLAERDAARARLEAARLEVGAQLAEAEALLEAASQADARSSVVVEAARAAFGQAQGRFDAGLLDITLVAAAKSRAREAELASLSARFDVLRAALARDYARGDLGGWMEPGR
ncbi:MAG: TolC family protein [Candidatus Binatia bacterium]